MLATIIAAAISSATPGTAMPSAPVDPNARPAIWVINDHDTVIYLFGTFHSLDGRSQWFNHEVQTAFSQSDELVLETLAPRQRASSDHRRDEFGLDAFAPDRKAPGKDSFLDNGKSVIEAGRRRGMSIEKGADTVLRKAAEQVGKPVAGLESFEGQVAMFRSLPGQVQAASPRQAQVRSDAMTALLEHLQAAWSRGDLDSFTPMLEAMRTSSPRTYQAVFADRNLRWADWIARRLQLPGTVFVAVGAGHLAGRDSVQSKLAEAGYRTARIN